MDAQEADVTEVIVIADEEYSIVHSAPADQTMEWSIALTHTVSGNSYVCSITPSLSMKIGQGRLNHKNLYNCLIFALFEKRPEQLRLGFKFSPTEEAQTDPEGMLLCFVPPFVITCSGNQ